MLDKRNKIGRMIDSTKVVYICLRCSRRHIGDVDTNIHHCPKCNHTDEREILLVMESNLVVRK